MDESVVEAWEDKHEPLALIPDGLSRRKSGNQLTGKDAGSPENELALPHTRAKRNVLLWALNLLLRRHVDGGCLTDVWYGRRSVKTTTRSDRA